MENIYPWIRFWYPKFNIHEWASFIVCNYTVIFLRRLISLRQNVDFLPLKTLSHILKNMLIRFVSLRVDHPPLSGGFLRNVVLTSTITWWAGRSGCWTCVPRRATLPCSSGWTAPQSLSVPSPTPWRTSWWKVNTTRNWYGSIWYRRN